MKFFLCIVILFFSLNIYGNANLQFLNNILKFNNYEIGKSYERLSGGTILLRDDPANYVIYQKLEAQMREIGKRINNNEDMISYYTYMDGALSGLDQYLQRIRELLVQRDNGILSNDDKSIIDDEIKQNYDQISYDLAQAEFNKIKVFGDLLNDPVFKNYFDNKKYYDLKNVDNLLNYIIKQRAIIGSMTNMLEYRIKGQAIKKQNTASFISHGDTDYATELSRLQKYSLLFMINILLLK